jgi:hypothetical protein
MKTLYSAIGVGAVLVIVLLAPRVYEDYKSREVVDIYQCPNPTGEYFDCELWPKKQ